MDFRSFLLGGAAAARLAAMMAAAAVTMGLSATDAKDTAAVSSSSSSAEAKIVASSTGATGLGSGWPSFLQGQSAVHLVIEGLLVLLVLYILLKRPRKKKSLAETLPPHVVDELVDEFKPLPLCPPLTERAKLALDDAVFLENSNAINSHTKGIDASFDGNKMNMTANFTTYDFLGFGEREELKDAASKALSKYGCGSCGPRGFYGTIDAHVYLEDAIAKFFGQEESIMYSDSCSAVSSAIPAFASRADLLLIDNGCNDAILTGCKLSRARLRYFKHNDMQDLQRILEEIEEEDRQARRKTPQRRFLVIEGLYRNFGDLAPLPELVEFKRRYKWRIFCDESCSFGALGKTGRGITDHFDLPVNSIEILVSSLATTLASVGGFCVGIHEVVEHQRLSGAGYCFSASAPPFLATVAQTSLDLLEKEGEKHLETLRGNVTLFHELLNQASTNGAAASNVLKISSDPSSPIIHLRLQDSHREQLIGDAKTAEEARLKEEAALQSIAQKVRHNGFLISRAHYIELPSGVNSSSSSDSKPVLPPASIKVFIHSNHEQADIRALVASLIAAGAEVVLGKSSGISLASLSKSNGVVSVPVHSRAEPTDAQVTTSAKPGAAPEPSTARGTPENGSLNSHRGNENGNSTWLPTLSAIGIVVGAASIALTNSKAPIKTD